ncbi:Peroxidase 43 [Acorus calamus]|uniref:Peroxidase n=1 Tax=Acorus calamus TaxID=4465 RepID=A0AAV9DJG0_ACOCL|nr:Peroxidase 43 [Acorus calamus]
MSSRSTLVIVLALILLTIISFSHGQLQLGFYSSTCPDVEDIVTSVVRDAILSDPTVAAALLRMHYHDCFVHGCDASVLIEGPRAERGALNHAGLRGFDVIERAKSELEEECPGVVSCADIVALAARDSIVMSDGPSYEVPTGRRDGRRSNMSDADNMPELRDSVDVLRAKFAEKGLSETDLVLLSAAHTIGTTACFFMERRLYDFAPDSNSDPSISPDFLPELESQCPRGGDVNARLPLDRGSEWSFDDGILRNIRGGFAVLESDAKLYLDESTQSIIDSYFGFFSSIFGPFFESDFTDSIVRMGQIGVKTGSHEGEIRQVCSAFN